MGSGIPVYAVWHRAVGPMLAIGRLTAAARAALSGTPGRRFDIHRPEPADVVLAHAADHPGPAVLLCSNYLWSVDDNLRLADRLAADNPELLVIHGGPSTPGNEDEAHQFLVEHANAAHVLVHGEGEDALVEVLRALDPDAPRADLGRLRDVSGVSFLAPDGTYVRTDRRERRADLAGLPSPFLSGEFDDIAPAEWVMGTYLETNRGCPYGCTFCDWGSSTMSRVRFFPLDDVAAEIEWMAERGHDVIGVCDANFGMTARDVDVVRALTAARARTGYPRQFIFPPAKNTIRHLVEIVDLLLEAEIDFIFNVGLQSADPDTLAAIHRSNISTEKMLRAADALRARGLPLPCEFIAGLPGQTYESFRDDLQFAVDHGLLARVHVLRNLPNAPVNDPSYREQYALKWDETGLVTASSTFTEADLDRMLRLVRVHLIADHFGVLRHLTRWAQWDHGVQVLTFLERVSDLTASDPSAYPALTGLVEEFLRAPQAPRTWGRVMSDAARFLVEQFGVVRSSAFDTVLAVQEHALPARGRTFPSTIELDHDYVAYHRSAEERRGPDQARMAPARLLEDHGAGRFEVAADPLDVCGTRLNDGTVLSMLTDRELFQFTYVSFELSSALTTPDGLARIAAVGPSPVSVELAGRGGRT